MYLLTVITTALSLICAIVLWNTPNTFTIVFTPLVVLSLFLSLINKKHKVSLLSSNIFLFFFILTIFFFRYIFFANP
ncbi:hypothetical protein MKY91_17375 [Alkalicoccobacillus gibsonii]|uniref:DUF3953 domain-containing protein n=1 Tax=Alkalicoccobacillus gibsonii TaxID=79881 RepID=A0ABU9VLZ5_9BACI